METEHSWNNGEIGERICKYCGEMEENALLKCKCAVYKEEKRHNFSESDQVDDPQCILCGRYKSKALMMCKTNEREQWNNQTISTAGGFKDSLTTSAGLIPRENKVILSKRSIETITEDDIYEGHRSKTYLLSRSMMTLGVKERRGVHGPSSRATMTPNHSIGGTERHGNTNSKGTRKLVMGTNLLGTAQRPSNGVPPSSSTLVSTSTRVTQALDTATRGTSFKLSGENDLPRQFGGKVLSDSRVDYGVDAWKWFSDHWLTDLKKVQFTKSMEVTRHNLVSRLHTEDGKYIDL